MCKTKETITAAVLDGGKWQLREIERGIRPLQGIVGGLIEVVPIDDERLTLYCNEEGKLMDLEPTAIWVDQVSRRPLDILMGGLVALGPADECGDDTDATPQTIAALGEHLVLRAQLEQAS